MVLVRSVREEANWEEVYVCVVEEQNVDTKMRAVEDCKLGSAERLCCLCLKDWGFKRLFKKKEVREV